MADRYLLESSSVDGYLLEDNSGVLLLDTAIPLPAFVAATSGGDNSFSAPSISATAPTTAVGYLEIIECAAGALAPAVAPTFSTPSGWNSGGNGGSVAAAGGAVNTRMHLFWRISPDTGSAATLSAGTNCAMVYMRKSYSNASALQLAQVVFGVDAGGDTSVALPSLTTGGNSLLSAGITQGAAQSITPPGGTTERIDNATYGISSFDEIAAGGATGTRTFTLPAATDAAWCFAEFATPAAVSLLATEADVPYAPAGKHLRSTGLAAETGVASALSMVSRQPLGTSTETDSTQALSGRSVSPVGAALEVDTALALSSGGTALPIGLATETNFASALIGKASLATGLSSEADTAVTLAGAQKRAVGASTEADSSSALPGFQLQSIGAATETDTASALFSAGTGSVGTALEINTASALPGSGASALPVGAAAEVDNAFALSSVYVPPVTGTGGGGGGHTGAAVRKHRWEADKKLWAPSENAAEPIAPATSAQKPAPVKLRDTTAARALLEKALAPKAATVLPATNIITTIVADSLEPDEEFEVLLAFALLD